MLKRWKTDFRVCSPERAAATCLRDVGIETTTNGCWRHEFNIWIFNAMPLWMMQNMMFKVSQTVLKKIRAREAEKEKNN